MQRFRKLSLICGTLAALYLAVAAGRLAAGALPLISPPLSVAKIKCVPVRCWVQVDSVDLVEGTRREDHLRSPAGRVQLDSLLAEPEVRGMLSIGAFLSAVPSSLLFLFLALAFRRFARGEGFDGRAAASLRHAATAAVVAVLVQPFADSIKATALSPAMTGRQQLFITFNGGPFFWGLLLAGAVWVAVWALEQGRLAQAELAEIV